MSDIYLEKDGLKFAVVRSYHAKEAGYGYSLVLDKMYLTDEFMKYQDETGDASFPINFRLVIEKPYGSIVYDRCVFVSFEVDYTNVEIRAIIRNEIPASGNEATEITKGNKPPESKYTDSTLKGMSKDELIRYIRILEHNYAVAVKFNEQQAQNIENFLKGLKTEHETSE